MPLVSKSVSVIDARNYVEDACKWHDEIYCGNNIYN